MATAAPFVKLLRQLSSAKDEYRSGALDISWDGTKATLFLVFGQPNHATYEADGEPPLEGNEALAALLHNLPKKFTVASWRKAVVRNETLKMSLDELMEPFAQLAGASSGDEEAEPSAALIEGDQVGTGFVPEFEFSVDTFPLLPVGEPMWSDAAVNVVHLDLLIPKLPSAVIVLTGARLRAAAITLTGQLIDAVWVDDNERSAGEGAAMALMGAREGTVSCYRLEESRFAEALTMLWRCPPRYKNISLAWLDPTSFLDSLTSEQRDCALCIDGPISGVAFFMGGHYVGGYTSEDRVPTTSLDPIRALLQQSAGTLTILQRAGDKAIGAPRDESSYHAAPATTAEPAPSYAAGAAAIESGEAPAAAPEPEPEAEPAAAAAEAPEPVAEAPAAEEPAAAEAPAWPAADEPAAAEAPAWQAADEPAAAAEPATEPGAWPAPAEEAPVPVETPAAAAGAYGEDETPETEHGDWGGDIGADFFGAGETAAAETPATEGAETAPSWFSPEAGAAGEQPAEEPAAFAGWGTPAEAAEPAESGALAGWGSPAETPAAAEEEPAPFTSGDIAGASNHAEETAPSPFLFGMGGTNGSTAEAPVEEAVPDATEVGPRLDLDFDTIKEDLIQIGVLWLGSEDVAPVADLIRDTKPSVDAFVATIDAIKGISVAGHDPSVIRAMAREMHYHAAEYLSGA